MAIDYLNRLANHTGLPDGFNPPAIEILHSPLLEKHQVNLGLLRLDQLHPEISGNKWFKLKKNIRSAKAAGKRQLLSFGGVYSNHLAALAATAARFGMESIGMVRGWHGKTQATPTLEICRKAGMCIHFLGREAYRQKESPAFLKRLKAQYPEAWIIPEGGNNGEGIAGAAEIAAYIPPDAHYVILPVGTGTTMAGIRLALPAHQQVLGMVPFKQKATLEEQIRQVLEAGTAPFKPFRVCNDYHFGGFAKSKPELIAFINAFYKSHGIPLDYIYTGKMLYGLMDLISKDQFPSGSQLCALHTGGLQGNQSRKDLIF